MERVRAFVGIDLPREGREQAARLGAALAGLAGGGVSPVRAEAVHLTLRFLGDVPATGPAGLGAIVTALAAVSFAPFSLRCGGGGFFPDMTRPRVAWAGLADGAPQCRALAAAVEAALVPLGFPPDPKPYRPHLTLARIRDAGRGRDWPGALRLVSEAAWPTFPVAAFTLWRSILAPAGARHEVLAVFAADAG
ncbi:MAG: RNA 2',3'-cyclic phosphodiesterase [Solidesulfovibrio sp.]|uniref:RNA 2',3'-cyclic phosphodiesterase n=1 Tax=Solidesulfovibrio sp. TaxID=2910990 RepID=UPI002B1F14D2|nr:RNA 2',3'-cyclic phosphodiesterase [Solidesulfovibrio sp.]MEA4855820.1 RNA 2',3'-cyclic phosphodiesterase [Solidesulfovibrio sp.]